MVASCLAAPQTDCTPLLMAYTVYVALNMCRHTVRDLIVYDGGDV